MRVRILSGNQAGGVTDVPQVEGEVMVATGYAEAVATDPLPPVEPVSIVTERGAIEEALTDTTPAIGG